MRKIQPRKLAAGALALGIVIQLVPYGRRHSNPMVTGEPPWDSGRTRALFFRACGDCHSNDTRWPWYSHVAPVSWMLQSHVEEGRSKLNVSCWSVAMLDAGSNAERQIRRGKMPLRSYRLGHPEARLTDAEKAALMAGLKATVEAAGTMDLEE